MPYKDPERRKALTDKYRELHREKLRADQVKYRREHPERVASSQKKSNAKRRLKVLSPEDLEKRRAYGRDHS
jgi:hypothetical protein